MNCILHNGLHILLILFQMIRVFLFGIVAVMAMALPSYKLPVSDEHKAEETERNMVVAFTVPDVYPFEVVHQANEMDLQAVTMPYRTIRGSDANLEEDPRVRFIQSYLPVTVDVEEVEDFEKKGRTKRSFQPGAPTYGVGGGQDKNWGADVRRDGPDTKVIVNGKHKGNGYDVEGQWSKVVRGPGKAKPDWRIGVRW